MSTSGYAVQVSNTILHGYILDSRRPWREAFQRFALNMRRKLGLDRRPIVHDYVETHVFMSEKCFVSYPV